LGWSEEKTDVRSSHSRNVQRNQKQNHAGSRHWRKVFGGAVIEVRKKKYSCVLLSNQMLLCFSDIQNPLEGKYSASEVCSQSCPYCKASFGIWVPPVQCSRCSKLVCAQKCCSQFFASLSGSQCRGCWGMAKVLVHRGLKKMFDSYH
jgi:hypothetical protein